MKKTVSFLLTAAMAVSGLVGTASAASAATVEETQ